MDNLQQVRARFAQDVFATRTVGIEIVAVDYHYAKCKMTVQPIHKNAADVVMGGAIFTLADFAFAVASNEQNPLTVTLSAQTTFLASATGTELVAEARCIKDGKTTCYYEVEVYNDKDKLVAKTVVNGYKLG